MKSWTDRHSSRLANEFAVQLIRWGELTLKPACSLAIDQNFSKTNFCFKLKQKKSSQKAVRGSELENGEFEPRISRNKHKKTFNETIGHKTRKDKK